MKYDRLINKLIEQHNGIITATQVTEAGVPRYYLSRMLHSNKLNRVARGVYCLPEVWEDELFILQYKYRRGIFSHETALDIHGLTDRMAARYVMTFPAGYNTTIFKNTIVEARTCKKRLYEIGITEKTSACGNPLKVYDVERTLCDISRGSNRQDIQLINQAMKAYVRGGKTNISKLMKYAEALHVKGRMQSYMEILL
jgi:predicted transcriptional regulator of viral defense system